MEIRSEMQLLRRAIARGLLAWEDLEAVAERVAPTASGRRPESGAWIAALVDDGRLSWEALEQLGEAAAEEAPPPSSGAGTTAEGTEATVPSPVDATEEPARRPGSALPGPPLDLLEHWERYEVITFLGAGGMGAVYKAFDPRLARFVALKFLHRDDPAQEEKFLDEARSQARVDHPGVCQVFETGAGPDGRPYIAMQYLDGETLDDAARGLPAESIVRLLRDVASAVHAAHRTGLIHRDLKPGNILVTKGPAGSVPHVVDFGLAEDLEDPHRSPTEGLTGTPAYLAPEQIRGEAVDRRTDVYSLGVVLYELLAGRTPFAGTDIARTLYLAATEPPPPLSELAPSVPPDLSDIVGRCLEKAPADRYESARALAEDLDRYLDGEPVAAARQTLRYRWGKRLVKHRRLAAVAALAALALLVLASLAVRERWLARERSELARRFGQQVTEMESSLRFAALLPLHDTTRHRQALLERMDRLRGEMAELGETAVGPGHYSLGRAYLALHDHEAAYEHLDRAWREGYRAPEVAAALGRVMGALYVRSLAEAEDRSSPEVHAATRRDVQETFREPAVAFLRESAASGAATPYVQALLALHEERWDDAVGLAREAWRAEPWLYEARQIEADVAMGRGEEALLAGRYDEARAAYEAAGRVYAELLEMVRSDPALYAAECGRRLQMAAVAGATGELDRAQADHALAACRLALAADPAYGEAHSKSAKIHWLLARQRLRRGEDPAADLERSVAAARKAIELDDRDLMAHGHLSIAHRMLAGWQMGRGLDPSNALARSIGAARRAIEIEPSLAANHSHLGNAHALRARHDSRRGVDPRGDLDQAIASYERSLTLDPEQSAAAINLGHVWTTRAEVESELGLDPTGSLDRAIDALETALAINPNAPAAHNNLGNAHLTLGVWQLDRGLDPRDALARAGGAYRRALDLFPGYAFGHYNVALVERSLAEHLLERGESPLAALERARRALAEAERLNPTDADNDLELARVELVAGRFDARRARSPEPALGRAAGAVEAGLALNPEEPSLHLAGALVERYRAELGLGRGAERSAVEQAILAGLERVDRALAINPTLAEALAVRGALHHLAASVEGTAESRAERRGAATRSLEAAIASNPLLEREYAAVLESLRHGG